MAKTLGPFSHKTMAFVRLKLCRKTAVWEEYMLDTGAWKFHSKIWLPLQADHIDSLLCKFAVSDPDAFRAAAEMVVSIRPEPGGSMKRKTASEKRQAALEKVGETAIRLMRVAWVSTPTYTFAWQRFTRAVDLLKEAEKQMRREE